MAIPAWNEAETIASLVRKVVSAGWDALVVDDGSVDATAVEAHRAGAFVICHTRNQGYDRALATGCLIGAGRSGVVVTIDGDGQHDVSAVRRLVEPIMEGRADVVVGRRPSMPRMSERLFGVYGTRSYGIADPMCGMKAFRSEMIVAHFDALGPKTIGSGLALACARSGARVISIDVPVRPRAGESRFGIGFRAERRILAALLRCAVAGVVERRKRLSGGTVEVELSVFDEQVEDPGLLPNSGSRSLTTAPAGKHARNCFGATG